MFYKIGHRGACGYAPENTLASFKKALELNVDIMELDVRICQSGEIVTIHNAHINIPEQPQKLIKNTSYNILKQMAIPTLKEVLDLVNQKTIINIEIKEQSTTLPVIDLVKKYIVLRKWSPQIFIISSFNKKILKKVHFHLPEIPLSILLGRHNLFSSLFKKIPLLIKPHLYFAKKINALSINIHKNLINKKIVEIIHKKKLKVFVYTVNSPKKITALKNISVDGIFSDYPNKL
jgi:glycerophosphoryl diester phosphodiesterase